MESIIAHHYEKVLNTLEPYAAELIAVSKRQPNEKVQALYNLGHRDFGENRVQEFLSKIDDLPSDIRWHLIGHLQTNKVRSVMGKVVLIHSLDRLKLAKKIDLESKELGLKTAVLFQIKIADEESKFGYDFDVLKAELARGAYANFNHLDLQGVMGMATYTEDQAQVREEFAQLKRYFDILKEELLSSHPNFKYVSMGMSGDYEMALEEGANLVRIGSTIFGPRI